MTNDIEHGRISEVPRISQQQKESNRARILASAGEGFRTRGIDGIGIDEVMKTAGMTHGGFYNHFGSKEDLALAVLHQGFTDSLEHVASMVSESSSPLDALHAIVDNYLTTSHRDHPGQGCASATLVADAGRHGVDAQAEYTRGLEGYLAAFTDVLLGIADQAGTPLEPAVARERSIALFSAMVGALVISRAVGRADPALSDEVLAATAKELKAQ
ncbi:TetR/AcrR family transcriptional regulator [Aeromicrobium chenweiae]|uniref:TetR/AcrR family transcriptional regulator n=1 Tax=Aeromicrobium chenweiae TaxID=2079793 RepID=UPI001902B25D|nr:TetR/AcrR family transcriptional regulator [Aeromicrobium chenweiae]